MTKYRAVILAVVCAMFIALGGIAAQTDWSRSPFKSSRAAPKASSGKAPMQSKTPALKATMADASGNATAVIGDRIVAPGDTVEGYTVSEILPGRAVLRRDQKTVTLGVWK